MYMFAAARRLMLIRLAGMAGPSQTIIAGAHARVGFRFLAWRHSHYLDRDLRPLGLPACAADERACWRGRDANIRIGGSADADRNLASFRQTSWHGGD